MLQSIINTLYRKPRSHWKTWRKFGGYFQYQNMLKGEEKMRKAAESIIVLSPQNDLQALEVCFLTGKKYWHQTVFCAYSLQKNTAHPIHFHFYDDGSFIPALIETYKKQVAHSTFITLAEIEARLDKALPKEKYPYLHRKREVYKHIRKLTDVHAGSTGWKLMLDSDMLFWKEPTFMIDWLQKPKLPFYILDIENAYGFPKHAMEKLAENSIPDKINVGAIGLQSESINFEKLEYWAQTLESQYGNSYYLEQGLTAMLIGNQNCSIGLKEDYIVFPSENEILNKQGVLHHYVAESKKEYLESLWKTIFNSEK